MKRSEIKETSQSAKETLKHLQKLEMRIIKVLLDEVEISKEQAKDLLNRYAKTYIAMDCFMGGIPIETPEGMLQAEIEL